MLPYLETIERMGALALTGAGVGCLLRAAFILLFRVPAKGTLTYDGYRRMCEARNSAVILHERAPMPFTVQDTIRFTTANGQQMHVTVRRYAKPRDQRSSSGTPRVGPTIFRHGARSTGLFGASPAAGH
jgi:hypothetical protein